MYYTYEYCVLRGLSDIFKELTITRLSDSTFVYAMIRSDLGSPESKVLKKVSRPERLVFELSKDFQVKLDEKVIRDAYNNGISEIATTQFISDKIKSEWLKVICK